MQFSAVVLAAFAATAAAWSNGTVSYTTEVVDVYTTVCPAATSFSLNGMTYTVTESTTLTITNCPCTVVKPVTTTSSVYCNTCAVPTTAPVYANTTTTAAATKSVGTTSVKSSATTTPSTITASGANKAFALSGASLAGLLGLAAYLL